MSTSARRVKDLTVYKMSSKTFSVLDFASDKGKKMCMENSEDVLVEKIVPTTGTMVIDTNNYISMATVHTHVMGVIETLKLEILELKKQEESMVESFQDIECYFEKASAAESLLYWRSRLSSLQNRLDEMTKYEDASQEFRDAYETYFPKQKVRMFGELGNIIEPSQWFIFQNIIASYLNVVKKYVPGSVSVKEIIQAPICEDCNGIALMTNGNSVCQQCGKFTKIKDKDSSKLTNGAKGKDCQSTANVMDLFLCFNGKSGHKIKESAYADIRQYCKNNSLHLENMTTYQLYGVMRTLKLKNYYKHINMFAHVLLGKELPDAMRFKKGVEERCMAIEKIYNTIKEDFGRKNFLYAWYVLKVCLHLEGYVCKAENFLELDTRDSSIDQDRIMRDVCSILKDKCLDDEKHKWEFNGLV